MRTRVLALVSEAFGGAGGIAQYNRDLCRAMAKNEGTEVVVLPRSCGEIGESLPNGVTQRPTPGTKAAYALAALLPPRPPVHIVFCGHLNLAPLAYLAARQFKAKLWLQIHGIEAWQAPSYFRRRAADRADLVTAISRFSRVRFLAWAGIAADRVRVLPPTYGERFAPGPKSHALRKRHGLAGQRILLTVGRLAPDERYKGHDRVIGLLPELRRAVPDLTYVVAGDGGDRARLERLAHNLQVEDSVHFIGAVPPGELPDLYRTADVFVMPSTGEGFGIVFLEAAASGLPIVAGSKDGSVDALRDGTLGTLVDPDDREELMSAILAALRKEAPNPIALKVFERVNFADHVNSILAAIRADMGVIIQSLRRTE